MDPVFVARTHHSKVARAEAYELLSRACDLSIPVRRKEKIMLGLNETLGTLIMARIRFAKGDGLILSKSGREKAQVDFDEVLATTGLSDLKPSVKKQVFELLVSYSNQNPEKILEDDTRIFFQFMRKQLADDGLEGSRAAQTYHHHVQRRIYDGAINLYDALAQCRGGNAWHVYKETCNLVPSGASHARDYNEVVATIGRDF